MIQYISELEEAILLDPEIRIGLKYGVPRNGHPEGPVENHVCEILEKIELCDYPPEVRDALRIIAITHDSFKFKVDQSKPKIGDNNHGVLARRFAEKFISDEIILNTIELHDAYYYMWVKLTKKGIFSEVEFSNLANRIKGGIELYLKFMFIDGSTGDKSIEPRKWFYDRLADSGYLKNNKTA